MVRALHIPQRNPTKGNPASPNFALNCPEIVSAGFAYKGIDRLLLATDFRFLDYRDTSGFSQNGFSARGTRRTGLAEHLRPGDRAQYQATDDLTLRIGYTFNMNPIGNAVTRLHRRQPAGHHAEDRAGGLVQLDQELQDLVRVQPLLPE